MKVLVLLFFISSGAWGQVVSPSVIPAKELGSSSEFVSPDDISSLSNRGISSDVSNALNEVCQDLSPVMMDQWYETKESGCANWDAQLNLAKNSLGTVGGYVEQRTPSNDGEKKTTTVQTNLYPSHDGRFSCDNSGRFNQDFKVCRNILGAYDAMKLSLEPSFAEQMKQQRLRKMAQIKQKAAQLRSTNTNIQKGAFDFQIESLEVERGIHNSYFGFYSTQIATLEGYLEGSWPTTGRVEGKCIGKVRLDGEKRSDWVDDEAHRKGASQKTCETFVSHFDGDIFRNRDTRTALRMYAGELGATALKHQLQARELGKQIADLRLMKEKAFVQDQSVAQTGFSNFCEANPSHASCRLGNARPNVAAFEGGGINFNPGDSGRLQFGTEGETSIDEANKDESDDLEEGLDNILSGGEAPNSGTTPLNVPKAAKAERGSGGGGAGGGGAGGGGGASAPGITPNNNGAGAKGKKELKVSSFSPNGGKKRRRISIGGGKLRRKGSKYNPKGALANIRPKKKKRAVASMDIADREIGLFKKISGRYARLAVDKRITANGAKKNGKSK